MKRYFEQLTPQERRIVVGAGLFVFLLLNYFFVWGRFGERGREIESMNNANVKMNNWQAEVARKPFYERKIQQLETGDGNVSTEDSGLDLVRYITDKAVENQVKVPSTSRPVAHTNSPYLMEREANMQVQATEERLVAFLVSLGSGASAVRVKSMSLRPDGSHVELNANLTVVASYQIKPATKSRTPATAAAAPPAAATPRPPGPAGAPGSPAPPKAGVAANSPTNKPGILDRIGALFGRSTPAPTAAPPTNKPAPLSPRSAASNTNKANLNR